MAQERLDVLDAIRGAALLPVVIMNMFDYTGTDFTIAGPRCLTTLVTMFVEGKGVTMLAFLFGIGTAIQFESAQQKGIGRTFYLRRLAGLAAIGLIHGILVWPGDILVVYAVLGLPLLLLWRCSNKWLLIAAGGIAIAAGLMSLAWDSRDQTSPPIETARKSPKSIRIPSSFEQLQEIAVRNTRMRFSDARDLKGSISLLPVMIIGLWFWRKGRLREAGPNPTRLRQIVLVTMIAGTILGSAAVAIPAMTEPGLRVALVALGLQKAGTVVLASAYMVALALISSRSRLFTLWAVPLGKISLTNYVMQSVVCTTIMRLAYPLHGLGVYSNLGLSVALLAVQTVLSKLWLSHFDMGPLEFGLRRITYGSVRPGTQL